MEKRKQTRACFSKGVCTARFPEGELPMEEVQVSNLTGDGCCLELNSHQADALSGHRRISLELIQPWLPGRALEGEILWQRGAGTSCETSLRAGIKFLDASEGYGTAITRVVDGIVHSNPRGNAWILSKIQNLR